MKPKLIPVLEMAVENGIGLGLMRSRKHIDNPTDEIIKEHIFNAVMGELYEWFDMEEDNVVE